MMSKTKGFSLIEILVALFLASLLVAGLITIYLQVKSSNRLDNALADIQERARFTIALLDHRVRLAGDASCENPSNPTVQQHAIKGYQEALEIGECVHYQGRDRFLRTKYYLANTHRKNQQGEPIIALYEKPMGGRREELTAGIAGMKIVYGVDAGNQSVRYRTLDHIKEWRRVKSVKIALLFRSINVVLRRPTAYWFEGKQVMPNDRHLYKPWVTYIMLRE